MSILNIIQLFHPFAAIQAMSNGNMNTFHGRLFRNRNCFPLQHHPYSNIMTCKLDKKIYHQKVKFSWISTNLGGRGLPYTTDSDGQSKFGITLLKQQVWACLKLFGTLKDTKVTGLKYNILYNVFGFHTRPCLNESLMG